jgi:enoyl-CoA hydratase/carnithine racemase
MTYETVTYAVERGVGVLTLNRPDALNAMNHKMVEEIVAIQKLAVEDNAVNALLVQGAGRAFSAGFDLKESDASSGERTLLGTKEMLKADFDMIMGFWHCPKPTVAAVQGYCLAGACELALACDMTVASADARFGEPEVRFGAGIVVMLMPWMTGPKQAKELLLTGRDRVTAERALAMGLINEVVPEGQAQAEGLKLARELAILDPHAVRMTKEAINRTYENMGMTEALQTALDIDLVLTSLDTPDRRKFREVSKKDGLKAALAWRESRFVDD